MACLAWRRWRSQGTKLMYSGLQEGFFDWKRGGGFGEGVQNSDCDPGYRSRGDKAMSKNCDELRAQQWLTSQGYTDIRDLSIDGKDPPDFVVNNRIGVEVRRLTWMTDTTRALC